MICTIEKSLFFWCVYILSLLSMCVKSAVCWHVFVQLDDRKASSLPHHHPFGLFLGGSQAPVWNDLSPVSTPNPPPSQHANSAFWRIDYGCFSFTWSELIVDNRVLFAELMIPRGLFSVHGRSILRLFSRRRHRGDQGPWILFLPLLVEGAQTRSALPKRHHRGTRVCVCPLKALL